MSTNYETQALRDDALAEREENFHDNFGNVLEVAHAESHEDGRYVDEGDLYGDPDQRQNGHFIVTDDGWTRYVGGPAEPQW